MAGTDTETTNEKLARVSGWVRFSEQNWFGWRDGLDHLHKNCPDYEHSLDAQEAPGGPAELARARGWRLDAAIEGWSERFRVGLGHWQHGEVWGTGPTLASAFAEAYCKALEARNDH